VEGDTVDVVDYIVIVLDTSNLPVQTGPNGFWNIQKQVNAELHSRFSSHLALNLDQNHSSVPISSGSNHSSKPDPSITIQGDRAEESVGEWHEHYTI